MRIRLLFLAVCLSVLLLFCRAQASAQDQRFEGKVVFAQARDVVSKEAAEELVAKCVKAGFNVLVLQVKDSNGTIHFASKSFAGAQACAAAVFDPTKAVLEAAHEKNLIVHAGFCAFLEGPASPVAKDHPEWVAITPEGRTTSSQENSPGLWMCPARRPGYADKYLIPMIEEFLGEYDVDGIHLTHLSFPGETGPDSYCFCDYCIQEFPADSRLFYPVLPGMRFEHPQVVPDPLAAWLRGGTALPADYDSMTRKVKAEYLLKGGYFKRGPSDMDYFFYTYRTDAIHRFCSELYEHARTVSPDVEFSASVYWNAPAAGRFAGQRWTDFGQWFDFLVLDLSRKHLPGDFDTYRRLLSDAAFYAARRSSGIVYAYAGLDLEGIYDEELKALEAMRAILADITSNPGKDPRLPAMKLAAEFEKVKMGLAIADKVLAAKIEESIAGMIEASAEAEVPAGAYGELNTLVNKVVAEAPKGFYRVEKLDETLRDLLGSGAKMLAVTDVNALDKLHLWERLPAFLGTPSREPYRVMPLRAPSVQTVRLLVEKQDQLASAKAQTKLLEQRLNEVNRLVKPLRERVEEYSHARQDKLDQLEGLLLEIETLRAEYETKITEMKKMGLEDTGVSSQAALEASQDLTIPPTDANYGTLRRKLEERTEELRIAMGQFERARDAAFKLTVELEKAHEQLTEQKQEYLYYVSILIAVACLGLAVVLVVSLVRQKR